MVVGTTQDQCLPAVRAAVVAVRRVTVRAGGCCTGFVTDNPGGVVLDVSGKQAATRTPDGGIRLESGCTNWDGYELLYQSHGVTLPAGSCYSVG